MLVEGGEVERNLLRAERMIELAAMKGADLVLLPECLDTGWTHPSCKTAAQPIPGKTSNRLAEGARKWGVYVVAGITERDGEKIFNSGVLISPNGETLLKHRKINELDIAQHLYSTGDSLAVANTPIGTIGINICADNLPGSLPLGHALARMGAQIILSPCAWAVPVGYNHIEQPYADEWIPSYTTLANLYRISMVGVSNVGVISEGPWSGWKCIGCSLAVNAEGKVAYVASYGESAEECKVIDLQLEPRFFTGTALVEEICRRGYCE
ncbi:carbon-nitrogen hydrolase family protein [Alicyclobacillus tolerans]|uniref:carbon-nitrogen hydrolase family protein n=1 Tax=Alicyclobacillus tolerans TaxID=90970 RepID=UPI001F200A45|nr:carbon-nitrogen hydrolase family protein [Alicyclobacillus tolerans]MCF8565506.1 carbon-nitrogen hydrolase family protein [Alicyclobacillus tolerans]